MKEKFASFDPHYNNRMPVYVEKPLPERKYVHVEIVEGKRVWIEGKKLNRYAGIDGESLKLQSRIAAGTFEDHEGVERKLEKAVGSDVVNKQIEKSRVEMEKMQEERFQKEREERMKKELREIAEKMKNRTSV